MQRARRCPAPSFHNTAACSCCRVWPGCCCPCCVCLTGVAWCVHRAGFASGCVSWRGMACAYWFCDGRLSPSAQLHSFFKIYGIPHLDSSIQYAAYVKTRAFKQDLVLDLFTADYPTRIVRVTQRRNCRQTRAPTPERLPMLGLPAAEPLRMGCGALLVEQFLRSRMELPRLAPFSFSTPGDCYRSSQPETVTMRTKVMTKIDKTHIDDGDNWGVEMSLTEAHVRDEDRAVIGYKLSSFCREVPARQPTELWRAEPRTSSPGHAGPNCPTSSCGISRSEWGA